MDRLWPFFFGRLEGTDRSSLTAPEQPNRDTDQFLTPSVETSGARDHAAVVSSPDAIALAELRAFIANLASVLAIAAKQAHQEGAGSFSTPAPRKSGGGDVPS
jgi:hypothetical protein